MKARFEWDVAKAASNRRKHRISFDTAALAFDDPLALVEQDRIEHGEERWQTIGKVEGRLLLLVAHTVRDDEEEDQPVEIIRIISAREATPGERRRYEQQNGSACP